MSKAAPGRRFPLLCAIFLFFATACETRAPGSAAPADVDAGEIGARAAQTRQAANAALDDVRRAATAATPPLDAGQKSGVNE